MAKPFAEREMLDRIAYTGPTPGVGGGVTIGYDWTGAETDTELWVPQTGNRFAVSCISVNASTKCTVSLFDNTDSTIDRIYKGVVAADSTVVIPFPIPRISRDPNRTLRLTTSGAAGFLTIWGWEIGYGELSTTTSVSTSSSSVTTTSESTSSSSVTTTSYSTSSSSQTTSSSSSSTSSQTTSSSSSTSHTTSSSSYTTSSTSSSSSSSSSSSVTTTSATITYL